MKTHLWGAFFLALFSLVPLSEMQAMESVEKLMRERPKPIREIKTEADFSPEAALLQSDPLLAIRKTVQQAIAFGKPCKITLPEGKYVLAPSQAQEYCFLFEDAHDIIFDAGGSEFIITNPLAGMILMKRCGNIIIRNFSLDYDPLPYAFGIVTAVDAAQLCFTVRLEDQSPELDLPYFRQASNTLSQIRNPDNPQLAKKNSTTWLWPKSWKKTEARTYCIEVGDKKWLKDMQPGDPYLQTARENRSKTVHLSYCRDITLENITCYASPSGGICNGLLCSNVGIFHCNTLIKPGRWISANADAVHLQRNEWGPWVEDCRIDGIADDAVNIYAIHHPILRQPDPSSIVVPGADTGENRNVCGKLVGSTATIFDPVEGKLLSRCKIVSYEQVTDGSLFRLECQLPILKTGRGYDRATAFFDAISSRGFVFRNNTVTRSIRFGIAVPTAGGLIEGNTFEDCGGPAINVSNHQRAADRLDMYTGGDLIIRDNRIKNCDFSATWSGHNNFGAINLSVQNSSHQPAQWRALCNVLVENNTITDYYCAGIRLVSGGENVIIRNNTIRAAPDITLTPIPQPHAAILIENSTPPLVSGNTVEDPRGVKDILYLQGN